MRVANQIAAGNARPTASEMQTMPDLQVQEAQAHVDPPVATDRPAITAVHTAHSMSRNAGGLQFSVMGMCRTISAQQNVHAEVLAARDQFSDQDAPTWAPLRPRALRVRGPHVF